MMCSTCGQQLGWKFIPKVEGEVIEKEVKGEGTIVFVIIFVIVSARK